MELVQTCTRTWWWCVSMIGARFAVFARPARVLPSPSQATRNLSFPEVFSGARHVVVSSCCFTELVRVGLNVLLKNNPYKQVCARTYVSWACIAHDLQCLCVWGACCPLLAKQLVIFLFLGFHPAAEPVVTTCCSLVWYGLV